jgi:hypothetical protein
MSSRKKPRLFTAEAQPMSEKSPQAIFRMS